MTTTTTLLRADNPYKVGDGATLCGFSDLTAYTVIRTTRMSITLQRDKAVLLNGCNSGEPDALTSTPGGFVGHTEGTQRHRYEPDPDGRVVIARLKRKPRKVWTEGAAPDGGYAYVERPWFAVGSSTVISGRHEHYDFNF